MELPGWRLMGGTVMGDLVGGANGEGLSGAQWAGPSGWGCGWSLVGGWSRADSLGGWAE